MSAESVMERNERSKMGRHGRVVIFHRMGSNGQAPTEVKARFEPRKARIIDSTRAVRDELWSVVLADEAALRPPDSGNPSPPVPGDWFERPHGPAKLRIVAGGYPVAGSDGRAIAYHNPVTEVA